MQVPVRVSKLLPRKKYLYERFLQNHINIAFNVPDNCLLYHKKEK